MTDEEKLFAALQEMGGEIPEEVDCFVCEKSVFDEIRHEAIEQGSYSEQNDLCPVCFGYPFYVSDDVMETMHYLRTLGRNPGLLLEQS